MKKSDILLWVCCCFLVVACHDSEQVEPRDSCTVLVYMAADNNLNGYAAKNIDLMASRIEDFNGNLIVYCDAADATPFLMQLTYENGKEVRRTLKEYPEENSASPEVLARVIAETQELFPAKSYGLILWSHGMGWLPADYHFPGTYRLRKKENLPPTKYFATDEHSLTGDGKGMQTEKLAEALPDHELSFILFDACFMSSIETVYQLRKKAAYIIASPAEVIADGFPYDRIMPYLTGGEEEYKKICDEFYNLYHTHPNGGAWRSATIALIKTAGLEALAGTLQDILHGRANEVAQMNVSAVRRYTLIENVPDVFFDFGEYIRAVSTADEYQIFRSQLDEVVIYKQATSSFNNVPLPADQYSGLSTYIPLQRWSGMNDYYFSLEWPATVY